MIAGSEGTPVKEPSPNVFIFKADVARHFVRPQFRSKPNREEGSTKQGSLEPKFAIRRKFHSESKRIIEDISEKSLVTPSKSRQRDIRKLLLGFSGLKTEGTTIETQDTTHSKRINTEQANIIPHEFTLEEQPPEPKPQKRTNYLKVIRELKFRSENHSKKGSPDATATYHDTFPMSTDLLQMKYSHLLSYYEKDELRNYPVIYYMGKRRPKLSGINYNFDDDHGDLKVYAQDQLCYRYEVTSIIGKGSFGQVFRAYDHKNKEEVALKVVKNHSKYTNQALIEVKLLTEVRTMDPNSHYNIVRIKYHSMFRGHVCMTFYLLHMNLYEFLKLHKFKGFSLELIHRIAIQVLQALLLLHRQKIIHCDLKPENIMLRQYNKSGIKVIDMGSSCTANKTVYTYIQSRYYRAPEIILGVDYSTPIDMWSFGCILAELFSGMPLFPGYNYTQQVGLMVELLGTPPQSLIERSRRKKFFEDDGYLKNYQDAHGKIYRSGSKSLESELECNHEDFIRLISRCLEWYPSKRITPAYALLDKWIVDSLPGEVRTRHLYQMKREAPELFF